jgi:hypothetical protein
MQNEVFKLVVFLRGVFGDKNSEKEASAHNKTNKFIDIAMSNYLFFLSLVLAHSFG